MGGRWRQCLLVGCSHTLPHLPANPAACPLRGGVQWARLQRLGQAAACAAQDTQLIDGGVSVGGCASSSEPSCTHVQSNKQLHMGVQGRAITPGYRCFRDTTCAWVRHAACTDVKQRALGTARRYRTTFQQVALQQRLLGWGPLLGREHQINPVAFTRLAATCNPARQQSEATVAS